MISIFGPLETDGLRNLTDQLALCHQRSKGAFDVRCKKFTMGGHLSKATVDMTVVVA